MVKLYFEMLLLIKFLIILQSDASRLFICDILFCKNLV